MDVFMKKHSDKGVFFLRLGIGLVFLIHGIGKLFEIGPLALGIAGTTQYFASLGIPFPLVFAWVVALVETFGGLFILIGFLVRHSAILIAVDMVFATLLVHIPKGFSVLDGGFEYVLTLFLASTTLFFTGAGEKWALKNKFGGKLGEK